MTTHLISDEEMERIVLACVARGQATEEEIMRAIRWAERVRADALLLKVALDGKASLAVDEHGKATVYHLDAGASEGGR